MNNQIKSGKKPLSQKAKAPRIRANDIFLDPLAIDPKMKDIIEAKGYVFALINYSQYKAMGGVHEMHYQALSLKKLKEWGYATINDEHSFQLGNDVDGYVRRGDLILAVRPKAIHERHRQFVQQENERVSTDRLAKTHADELREYNRSNGIQELVVEGYEDDGEKEE